MVQPPVLSRVEVMDLIQEKTLLEREILTLKEILDLNSVGMNEPLVDENDYPRDDIDVFLIRHTRHKIICLQNDLKNLLKKIEQGVHAIHGQSRGENSLTPMSETFVNLTPIARVNVVYPTSPAHIAGLEVGDLIVQFGSINDTNFSSLKDFVSVVEHSASGGHKVHLTVIRSGINRSIHLKPMRWSGKGLLGCSILPMDECVDR